MERPIQQSYAPLGRLMRLSLIPVGIAAIAIGIILYAHGQTDLTRLLVNVLGGFLAFSPMLLVIALGMMQPTIKWFMTEDGLKRVIRGNVLMIPWKQIYHIANTDYGFYVRWRDPPEPGIPTEDLEHRARFCPTKADADDLMALWQRNTSREHQVGGKAHFSARNRRADKQLRAMAWGLAAVGALLIGWGGLTIARQYPSTKWPSVEGKVMWQGYHTFAAGGSHKHRTEEVTLSYEYVVAGQTNRSEQYSLSHAGFRDDEQTTAEFARTHQRGAIVTVYYNPKHPERAVLLTGPSWNDNYALMIGGGFLAVVGYAMRAVAYTAQRARKKRTI
jgi:hypothetical protein